MSSREREALQAGAGVGLRVPHVAEVIADRPPVPWFEIHAENYMAAGPAFRALERIRAAYPIAVHGVGLSLGSADGIDEQHLRRLRALIDRIDAVLVSEHLAWSRAGGTYFNHLLPLPYTEVSLARVVENVACAQEALGRVLLIENPSGYLRFRDSTIPEAEFLGELAARSGCRLLCDVNNVYVTCRNLGLDPVAYLDALPARCVDEVHLAGHSVSDADGVPILIDDHGSPVAPEVWALYARVLARWGPRPTLVEWDTALPALSVLIEEARHAATLMDSLATGERGVLAG